MANALLLSHLILIIHLFSQNASLNFKIKTARDNGRFDLRLEASATGHGLKAY